MLSMNLPINQSSIDHTITQSLLPFPHDEHQHCYNRSCWSCKRILTRQQSRTTIALIIHQHTQMMGAYTLETFYLHLLINSRIRLMNNMKMITITKENKIIPLAMRNVISVRARGAYGHGHVLATDVKSSLSNLL
jgi:hypothetical protein